MNHQVQVTIIDYGAGNLTSLKAAFERLGVSYEVTDDPAVLSRASKVVFPGQGAAGQAMKTLHTKGLVEAIRDLKVPFLGICLGLHLLYAFSDEGNCETLGVLSGRQKRFSPERFKVPQMGWNRVKWAADSPLFDGIPDESSFYFVHSYAGLLSEETIGVTFYGGPFAAMVQKDHFWGVQFHPEKSGQVGLRLLKNFIELDFSKMVLPLRPYAYGDARISAIIPAIDLMDGQCVRLRQGDYLQKKVYGQSPVQMASLFERMGYDWLHIIDLDGARDGDSKHLDVLRIIREETALQFQVGGGLRSYEAIETVLDAGVARVLVGSLAIRQPDLIQKAIDRFGPERIVVAMDIKDGEIRISGWIEGANRSIQDFLTQMNALGVKMILCTDISRDGMMQGPNFELYRSLVTCFPDFQWIAAGGIGSQEDALALQSVGVSQCVMGKVFYEGSYLSKRIIPCLDVKEGRVVKGVHFEGLKDAGDPVELARYYDQSGADELVFLDITATSDKRAMVADLATKVAQVTSIPFTIGGGMHSIEAIRSALQAGADKVSIESAAVQNPALISEAANYFGSQAIVVSVSPKRVAPGKWKLTIKGGRESTGVDLIDFLKDMQTRGAGEILLNSIDEDGRGRGYDLELLKVASGVLKIPLIASSGAGELEHFYQGLTVGGADAVLAASVFHYGKFTIAQVKEYLKERCIPMRF